MVIDSDKENAQQHINATKNRVQAEINNGTGLVWVTQGREIENYIAHDMLQAEVKKTNPTIYAGPSAGGKYDHALYFVRHKTKKINGKPASATNSVETSVDKVKVARLACAAPADLSVLDLEERVTEIVGMIKNANR